MKGSESRDKIYLTFTMKKRVLFLDFARMLCMLWIVGVWHMQAYLSDGFAVQNRITENVTIGVLATFTFISGFFLGGY